MKKRFKKHPNKKVHSSNTAIRHRMKGQVSLRKSEMGHLVMPQVVNIMEPKGGVRPPIIMLIMHTRPK